LLEDDAGARQSNFLFINTDELGETKWIWPESPDRVWFHRLESNEQVIAILYQTLGEQANASGGSTEESKGANIYLAHPDSAELIPVITGLDRLIGYVVTEKEHLVVLYAKAGEAYSVKVDLTDFSIVEHVTLPPVP
jgi:hypothetical protein